MRSRLAASLLILFSFAAWNLTGLAHVALALLCLLFLLDLPSQWDRLRRDAGLWLLLGGVTLTTLLATRAVFLFPDTAAAQWAALSGWLRPLLFVVVAWWLSQDPRLCRWVLVAGLLGLLVGIARKTGWSDLLEILHGARADFGYSALGIGFLASIVVLALVSFRREITGLRVGGRSLPMLGWALWVLLSIAFVGILIATQSRGATFALGLVVIASAIYCGVVDRFRSRPDGEPRAPVLIAGLLTVALVGTVLWAGRERIVGDIAAVMETPTIGQYGYESSLGIRINLHRIGVALIAERPLLGWGPGTSGATYLVPKGVIGLSEYDRVNAPQWTHLHSALVEVLVRFGLAGGAFALLFVVVIVQAYRTLRSQSDDLPLRRFLVLGGLLTLLFCLYDFRLVHVDLGFFFIVFFGILYSFQMRVLRTVPWRQEGKL